VVLAAAADAVWVLLFAGIGRHSHDETDGLAGIGITAWPFLAGAFVGWLLVRAWSRPLRPWPTGVAVWAATWAVGMALRLLTGQGIAPSFQVVAAVFLGLGIVGWRALAGLVSARRAR
jgi:hypothetical protein